MTIAELKSEFLNQLKKAYPSEEANSFFGLLSQSYLKMSRLEVALHRDKEVNREVVKQFQVAQERLLNQEPIQHIIGETEFYGLKIKVNKNVLVPRPETEELVQWIIEEVSAEEKEISILDVGTGSGCIALCLAKNLPQAVITAIDISEQALKTAKENAEKNKVQVNFIRQDILKLERLSRKYDVIVSNPPYVRELEKKEMQPNVLHFEPGTALFVSNENPLIFYKKITLLAKSGLKENGKLFFEINQYLGKETENLLQEDGFKTRLRKDIFGNFRMLKGEK